MARKPTSHKTPAKPKGPAGAPDAASAQAPAASETDPAAEANEPPAQAPAAGEAAPSLQPAAASVESAPAVSSTEAPAPDQAGAGQAGEAEAALIHTYGAEAWSTLPAALRASFVSRLVEQGKAWRALQAEIDQAFGASAGPDVEVTAYARHAKPYRRAGVTWTAAPQTVTLPAAAAELVRNDPHLVVTG